MQGLTLELNTLCRNILLKCEQFESYDRLSSFCKGHQELYFLNLQLKKANNLQELYELNLPILIESKHEEYGWIFPIFC